MAAGTDVVVVGAGPNGLAAALVMAAAGLEVTVYEAAETLGGGARTAEPTLPGFRIDTCSSVHPLGLASPFFRAFGLEERGVEMLQPDVAFGQPLDDGRAGLVFPDLERTAESLGVDGDAWRAIMTPLRNRASGLVDALLSDFRSVPPDLPVVAHFARHTLEQASPWWNARFGDDLAPALLSGAAAHAISPPRRLAPAAAGLLLVSLAHSVGWPLPRGGSQAMMDAMVDAIRARGGRFVPGHRVRSLAELPLARCVLLDVAPAGLLEIAGNLLPPVYARWLRAFRYGGAACKVDFALSGPVPWTAPGLDGAGTVHLGGTRAEVLGTEQEVHAGRHPERPFVIAVQADVVDGDRSPPGRRQLWSYGHVPNGSTVDIGDAVQAQVERFAPGFGDLVLARTVVTAAEQEEHDANYVGGDIAAGATTPWQMVMRPAPKWDPYATPLAGVYLCSSSTPPGPAVHGMGGVHATRRALRQRFGIMTDPLDLIRDTRSQ